MVEIEEVEDVAPKASEERFLDAEEIEKVAASMTRPTARMQLESLAKKLRKEAAALKIVEGQGTTTSPPAPAQSKPATAKTPAPAPAAQAPVPAKAPAVSASSSVKYTTIDRFAFDAGGHNDRFVTLYISMTGVGDIPKEKITCDFSKESFDLIVRDLKGKSYRLFKDNLEKDIVPDKSKYIVKADKVLVKLAKVKGEYGSYDYWSNLTDSKKKEKSIRKKSSDPASSINDMMREMYESGDDKMRKMIGETMLKQRNGTLDDYKSGDMGMGGLGAGFGDDDDDDFKDDDI